MMNNATDLNTRWLWLRIAAIVPTLLLIGMLPGSALAPRVTNAAPPAQGITVWPGDLCGWVPTGTDLGNLKVDWDTFKCWAYYDFSYPGGHNEFRFVLKSSNDIGDVKDAKQMLENIKSQHPRASGGSLGDEGIVGFEEINESWTSKGIRGGVLFFRRGRCVVELTNAPYSNEPLLFEQAKKIASAIDSSITKGCQPYTAPTATTPTVDLSISQADNEANKPFAYNPYSFRIKLRKPKGNGAFDPMPGEIVKLSPDLWNNYTPVFSQSFQASNCTNCGTQVVDGVKVTFIQDVTQPVLLKTDANGEATIALYLDMARLDEFGLAPTLDKALTTTFKVSYESNNQVLAKAETTISLKTVGIVERIQYIPPTLLDRNTGLPGLRQPQDLAAFTKENGDACAQDVTPPACSLDRVKIRHENVTWFAPPELATTPGETLKPGALVAAGDEIRIDVCDLPNLDRILKENPKSGPIEISYAAEIAVQIRFFDGVRGKFSVNETVRERSFDFWVERGTIKPYVSIKQFCGSRLLVAPFINPNNKTTGKRVMEALGLPLDSNKAAEWVTGQMMDTVVETVFPVYAKITGIVSKISTIFGYIQTVMNNKAVYTQVKSSIYAQSGANGITVTTRRGEPILFTRATGENGITVPMGQTATIPDSLIPQLQPTDPETAKRADALLASMQSVEMGGGQPPPVASNPTATNTTFAGMLPLVFGGAVCALFGVLLVAGLVVITCPRARPIAPPPERLPTRMPRPSDLPERGAPRKPTDLPK